jgi:ABC-type antimicrobial peptide transport system permease subunit
MGIRMSLGATPRSVITLMVTEGMRLVLLGGGVGIVVALAAARVFRTFLYGVSASDLLTFTAATAVLLAVSLVAVLPPALRAGRADPAEILRSE